jgi:hypothetical protein
MHFLIALFHGLSPDRLSPAVQPCRSMILLGVPLGSTSFRGAQTTSPGFFWHPKVLAIVSADGWPYSLFPR